jgi:peptide/nickel transport system permease protein
MIDELAPQVEPITPTTPVTENTFKRLIKYTSVRILTMLLAVIVGVYATVLIASLGGYMDRIISADIDETIGVMIQKGWLRNEPEPHRTQVIEQTRWSMQEGAGLHQPFFTRTMYWLWRGLTLGLGKQNAFAMGWKSGFVRDVILERLPVTLLLFGTANLLSFFTSISLALSLTRRYGGWLDRILVLLAPISSVPSWIHGVFLIILFAAQLRILPFGDMLDPFPPPVKIGYVWVVAKHMLLPVSAIFLSIFFKSVHVWRNYFLLHSSEDYVEMARAKGLPDRQMQKTYILRPAMPYVITTFALSMIMIWQESIALEILFKWPGIGQMFIQAVRIQAITTVVGIVVVFGYLLAISIFLLDIAYAFMDPRVRVDSGAVFSSGIFRRRGLRWHRPRVERVIVKRHFSMPDVDIASMRQAAAEWSDRLRSIWREMMRYRSARIGLWILAILFGMAVYGMLAYPQQKTVELWRDDGSYGGQWYRNPRTARPVWVNLFRVNKLPPTLNRHSQDAVVGKNSRMATATQRETSFTFPIDYPYAEFPQDLMLIFVSSYAEKKPFIQIHWLTPDGRDIPIADFSVVRTYSYILSQDKDLSRRLAPLRSEQAIFADPATLMNPIPLKGKYQLVIKALTFEDNARVDVELLLYGKVYGVAGTDSRRRDLGMGLLWGATVALLFGFTGAIFSSLLSVLIAAISVWFGGWVDQLIQRITEINLVIPSLPIAVMIYVMYSKSIWVLLGVIILLSILGTSVKNYRAAFLQAKELPYVEAARAYGVGNWRIIFHYLMPRIYPLLIPQVVTLVPTYVFLETTLAFLGLSDPYLPTWGKIIYDALTNGAYYGDYYWVLEPIFLVLLTGLAFTLVGRSLDEVLNPKLRQR